MAITSLALLHKYMNRVAVFTQPTSFSLELFFFFVKITDNWTWISSPLSKFNQTLTSPFRISLTEYSGLLLICLPALVSLSASTCWTSLRSPPLASSTVLSSRTPIALTRYVSFNVNYFIAVFQLRHLPPRRWDPDSNL